MEFLKLGGGGAGLILIGLALWETAITSDLPLGQKLLMMLITAPFLLLGGMLLKILWEERATTKIDLKGDLKEAILPDYSSPEDSNDTESLLSAFRENYKGYFDKNGKVENDPIQEQATQIYRNILELQRNRLDRLKIHLAFKSERKNYGTKPVIIKKSFDGKYEIADISEDIAAVSEYTRGGKKVYTKVDSETAHYTLINAKTIGGDLVYCPNCGARTTRSNLLDGCDFCGTRFAVEDLGVRVSDFSLRKNYEVQYDKYRKIRGKLNLWVGIAVGLLVFIWCAYFSIQAIPSIAETEEAGFFTLVSAGLFAAAFPTAVAVGIAVLLFDLFALPFIQIGASASRFTKKSLDNRKKAAKRELTAEKDVRKHDKLFSLANFYSGVQNKLAAIHFAETAEQANAYTMDLDLSSAVNAYKDVISMELSDITFLKYAVDKEYQTADVMAELKLVKDKTLGTASTATEKIKIKMVKAANCKTQAVCGPSVMTCKGCGDSISLLEGKNCRSCGRDIGLVNYDWVIREYNVM